MFYLCSETFQGYSLFKLSTESRKLSQSEFSLLNVMKIKFSDPKVCDQCYYAFSIYIHSVLLF